MSSQITFKRTGVDEARVYQDGDHVGDVYLQDDILNRGAVFYVVHLSEDPRGPVRVHERHRVREVVPPPPRHPSAALSNAGPHRRRHRWRCALHCQRSPPGLRPAPRLQSPRRCCTALAGYRNKGSVRRVLA